MLDAALLFSDAQSLVATAGAILSDKSIDMWQFSAAQKDNLGNTPLNDIGRGNPVMLLVQVVETFDSSGDAVTCKAELIIADDAALTSNVVILASTQAIAQATLVAGYRFRLGCTLPVGLNAKRYLGVKYTTAVADATAGKVTAGLCDCYQSNAYPV